jgi:hypothetical protein
MKFEIRKELYLYGTEKDITKVLDMWKKGKLKGIHLVDLLPDLKKEYLAENNIVRR